MAQVSLPRYVTALKKDHLRATRCLGRQPSGAVEATLSILRDKSRGRASRDRAATILVLWGCTSKSLQCI